MSTHFCRCHCRHLCNMNAAPLQWGTALSHQQQQGHTEGTLPGRPLCLLNVSPTVSRSWRNLGLGLNSGYSPYSLQAEGFSLCLCCLQWQQQAGPSPSVGSGLGLGQQGGTGGAEEILPWAWSSYREGTAGRRAETSCTQDYSSSVSL